MSWTWRKPRASVQSLGWQAPHELVDDYAARGVRIAELAGRLSAAENLLALCEADRAEWERVKSRMAARITELEQTVVAMSAASGLDAAWPDVAAVCGAQSETLGRQ